VEVEVVAIQQVQHFLEVQVEVLHMHKHQEMVTEHQDKEMPEVQIREVPVQPAAPAAVEQEVLVVLGIALQLVVLEVQVPHHQSLEHQ
jgi:hypothetical protein